MRNRCIRAASFLIPVLMMGCPVLLEAQEAGSSKAAARSDELFIDRNIRDNQDEMILLQKAIDQSRDARIREMAQQMITDHTAILYSLQELKAAGSGSSGDNDKESAEDEANIQARQLEARLSTVSGWTFDTMYVSNLLLRHQTKLNEWSQAKTTVTNSRLKMDISEAIPVIRKHSNELRILLKDLIKMDVLKKKEAARKAASHR